MDGAKRIDDEPLSAARSSSGRSNGLDITGLSMSEWYFAYGSNLWIDQMEERTGPIRKGEHLPWRAYLPNHRLTFNVPGGRGQVFANVLCPGAGVFGVLYSCSSDALTRLDQFE